MPGPWSRTTTLPSATVTSIGSSGGPQATALSSRLTTARSSRAGDPRTSVGSEEHERPAGARRRTRATESATSTSSRTSSIASSRSPFRRARRGRRRAPSAPRAARRRRRPSACARRGRSRRPARASRRSCGCSSAAFRSSCEASATRLRWAATDRSSDASISFTVAASRLSSSSPVTSILRERSAVRVISSAVTVSRRTGCSADRATRSPRSAAPPIPAIPITTRIARSRPRVSCTSVSGRATRTAYPGASRWT